MLHDLPNVLISILNCL